MIAIFSASLYGLSIVKYFKKIIKTFQNFFCQNTLHNGTLPRGGTEENMRVLVAEDEKRLNKIICEALEDEG